MPILLVFLEDALALAESVEDTAREVCPTVFSGSPERFEASLEFFVDVPHLVLPNISGGGNHDKPQSR